MEFFHPMRAGRLQLPRKRDSLNSARSHLSAECQAGSTMSVEVACPGCGLKLKAPDNRIGKKARCKKCDTHFRIPGPTTPGDSVGESHALSAIALPGLPPDDEDVPMALA